MSARPPYTPTTPCCLSVLALIFISPEVMHDFLRITYHVLNRIFVTETKIVASLFVKYKNSPRQFLQNRQMQEKKPFHTTTAAEFRDLAEAARAAGRLPELIAAISDRLERYRAAMQSHQAARDFQSIQETKKLIANLENKLQIASQLQGPDDRPDEEQLL